MASINASDIKSVVYDNIGKQPVMKPSPVKVDQDLKNTLFTDIQLGVQSNTIDIGVLNDFVNISRSRDQLYTLLESMAEDTKVSAVIDTYVEDVTARNQEGDIVWVESKDKAITGFLQYLLSTLNIEKNIQEWTYNLIVYGDVYLKLFRDKEYNSQSNDNKKLNEDVHIYDRLDLGKYAGYVEMVPNPAEMFELMKFGKTYGYIQSPVPMGLSAKMNDDMAIYGNYSTQLKYKFNEQEIRIFQPTEYVHACLFGTGTRYPETVELFGTKTDYDSDLNGMSYKVRRGQSLLYPVYKIWRELTLLENSMILNRLTQSSIVRVIGVEVGDMPKEQISLHLQQLKQMIEQKSSLQESIKMSEYNNPGPMINNIYVPTHQGIGNISTQQIGGDVDIKSLGDIDYFNDEFYGGLKVPKAYFSRTGDGAGFNGGESLALISSRYAKTVRSIQQNLINMITDVLNLMLIDRGFDAYVNRFQVKMQAPYTTEERERTESLSNQINGINDVIGLVSNYITDETQMLKIVRSMIGNVVSNQETLNLIQQAIDESINNAEIPEEDMDMDEGPRGSRGGGILGGRNRDIDIDIDNNMPDSGEGPEGDVSSESDSGGDLPSMDSLGMDFTDNSAM